jgi:hypothetical protein
MELYKSSIPAKYGGRLSSILDINGKEGSKEGFKGSAGLGLLTSQLTVEGPLFSDKTSYILGGRTTYSDWMLNQLPESSGYKDGSAGFYDVTASIHHRVGRADNIIANGYFSRDRFSFTAQEKYAYRNANASIMWRHVHNEYLLSVWSAGYDHYDYHTESNASPASAYKLDFGIDQAYIRGGFTRYADKHTIDYGINLLGYNLNPGHYFPWGDASLVIDDQMQKENALESALYLSDRWDITTKFSLDLGVRYSMFNALGSRTYNLYETDVLPSLNTVTETKTVGNMKPFKTYHGPEIRASMRYEFADNFSVKAGFNQMRQYIHKLSNTTIMAPTDTWKLSDANIKPQTGWQAAFGLYKTFSASALELSLEAYYKTMDNYLDYRNGAVLLMNHNIETDVLPTKGRAYGIEFMIRKNAGKLNGWLSYSYSRTELRQADPRIMVPVNDGSWYPADYDKPHDIKLVANYKFTNRYSISVNCDYSTGRPITLPVTKYEYAGGEYVYYSERNAYRIPDYFRTDISINIEPSHHLTLLTHSTVSLGVYNVTGRKNAYSVYYTNEDGQLKGYQLAIFGIPVPYISYNIRF